MTTKLFKYDEALICLFTNTLYVVLFPSSAVTTKDTSTSPSVRSYVPFPSIVAEASFKIPVTVISSTSSSTSTSYSNVSGLNVGFNSPSLTKMFFKLLSVDRALFTTTTYVLVSPLSAVAMTFITFLPLFNVITPSPLILVVSTSGVAFTFTVFTVDGTFIMYGP